MPLHWLQEEVRVNGTRLHYCRTGRGDKRPLVLVHGFSDNGLCWTPVAREFESEYDLIMPDMRGHGLSARVRPDENVDMAGDLADLIRALGLGRPVLVGHSMGAGVAFQTGIRFPELVGALALEDPPWWTAPPPASDRTAGGPVGNPIVAWAKDLPRHSLEELLAGYRRDHPDWPDELLRPMCESKKQLDPAIVDILAGLMRSPAVNWRTAIRSLAQPLLVITGSPEHGGFVTPAVIAQIRELKPDATIVTFPNAGHLIRFDDFTAYRDALRAFLKKIPPLIPA